ncbi:cell division protein FtsW [candidate division WOR-1 bacterium RIFOXYB2_FULL_48_7]|uniref:Cell division protein FtsW n=1 Tax=candidate division WOR-1 bacterium RIFOXYB2_FULL_48_7 TaxID=1802583 RepID=A0A1F4TMF9_UNCSA|nr:MAG: cell division protein FtsW [candidate division WOR-1 bacterium RIFOXYB2_FULL_48_7]
MSKIKNKIDYLFLFAVLSLLAIGGLMIFSASPVMGMKYGDSFYFIKRHLFYLLLGLAAFYYGFKIDLETVKRHAQTIFIIAVGSLALVFIPGVGRSVLGASRWIELGFISFQPSEFIKLATVIFLAKWLTDKQIVIRDFFRGLLPPLMFFGVIGLLIIKQPDLGTALTIGATVFLMLFVAGAQIKQLAGLCLAGIIGVLGLSVTSPYRLRRLVAYLDPWKDPQGAGFQIIQSLLAVGSGGVFGLGLGASKQKFYYLPQQFTDFIFAILCEELGLIGGAAVVVLFITFAGRGFKIALSSNDQFKVLLASGIVAWITIQAMINIMVVVGIVPTTGIPLPFISYGGTATIINLFAVGMVLNVSRKP